MSIVSQYQLPQLHPLAVVAFMKDHHWCQVIAGAAKRMRKDGWGCRRAGDDPFDELWVWNQRGFEPQEEPVPSLRTHTDDRSAPSGWRPLLWGMLKGAAGEAIAAELEVENPASVMNKPRGSRFFGPESKAAHIGHGQVEEMQVQVLIALEDACGAEDEIAAIAAHAFSDNAIRDRWVTRWPTFQSLVQRLSPHRAGITRITHREQRRARHYNLKLEKRRYAGIMPGSW